MIFVSSTTIYSSRNSGLVGRSRKVQYSLTRVLKKKKKNVYVASGIEPATINLCHNIIFLHLIASYKVQNFGIKSIRQQSIRHTKLANVSGKYRDQKFPRNIHISCPTGSRMKLLLTSLFATQGRILYQASKEKWYTRLGQSRADKQVSLLYRTLGKFGSPLQFSTDMPPSVYCCLRKN